MSKHFQRDMDNLHREVLNLSAVAEEMIHRAGVVLCEGGIQHVAELVELDREIDRREVAIEEECLRMLALHQPVAIDLRRVATVMKINNDLERIGDLALNIVERAESLNERPDFHVPSEVRNMIEMATEMVSDALNAFVERDAHAAREICRRDSRVDRANREIIADLVDLMEERPDLISLGLHCFSAVRQVERVADHATNIAEDVIYLVEGSIVRHGPSSELAAVT